MAYREDPPYGATPFEGNKDASQMKAERSPDLESHNDPFWRSMGDTASQPFASNGGADGWLPPVRMTRGGKMAVQPLSPGQRMLRFLGSGTMRKIVLALLVILLITAIAAGKAMKLRAVIIEGNNKISDEYIISLSELKQDQNTWEIKEQEVIQRIQSRPYLRVMSVDIGLNTVTITVREREPVAHLRTGGGTLVIDRHGVALTSSYDDSLDLSGYVFVQGMIVQHFSLGQEIILKDRNMLGLYERIIIELQAMQEAELLSELNLTDLDSITLTMRDGFRVRLGNEENIHAKLRAYTIVRDQLLQDGVNAATVDVSNPGRPTALLNDAADGQNAAD